MAKKKKFKLLEIGFTAFETYKASIRDNQNITYELAQKKLTRNMMLAREEFNPFAQEDYCHKGDSGTLFKYGTLHFIVRDNKVVWLRANSWYPIGWEKDWDRLKELNQLLGIAE